MHQHGNGNKITNKKKTKNCQFLKEFSGNLYRHQIYSLICTTIEIMQSKKKKRMKHNK